MRAFVQRHALRRACRTATLLAMLSLASCGPRDRQAPDALLGRWEGHVAWHDATTPLALVVRADGESLAVRFFAPALGVDSLEAGRFSFDSPRVHFRVPDPGGAVTFDGWLRRGLIVGAFSSIASAGVANPGLLAQMSLQRRVPPAHKSPWPDSLMLAPVIAREPERSLGDWLEAHAGR